MILHKKRIICGTCFHSLITIPPTILPPSASQSSAHTSPHIHTMHHSDLTDEIVATLWSLLQDNAGASDTPGPQGVHENSMAGGPFIANPDLFNSGNDTAFTPTLSSSVETSFTGQLNYSHPVSNQGFDRRHRLTLPCHRVMLMLGPCRPKVSPVLLLQQTLRVDRMRRVPGCKFCHSQPGG